MSKHINILYVSSLCSVSKIHSLFDSAIVKPHPAPQKYHSLMVKGLVANGQTVTCLVALPVTKRSHPGTRWWKRQDEDVDGVHYCYMPFFNQPFLKYFGFKIYAFVYTLLWALRTKGSKAMICDVLNAHASASMKACRLLGIDAVGIVTDIPGYMGFSGEEVSWIKRMWDKIEVLKIRRMTHFVLLTEAMCDIINPSRKKPYVVVEGLVDSEMKEQTTSPYNDGKRHITYTGTLNAAFGVRSLVKGFMIVEYEDAVLDIFGSGPMKEEMSSYMIKDTRIRYHGVVPIEEAVRAQQSSYLLVNPRSSKEEFTKFSFPSKNMEYMASGVPLLTAALPGMPKEYHPYVFIFEDETSEGIGRKMNEVLSMPIAIVQERGLLAKDYVMQEKNNLCQSRKVIEMLIR